MTRSASSPLCAPRLCPRSDGSRGHLPRLRARQRSLCNECSSRTTAPWCHRVHGRAPGRSHRASRGGRSDHCAAASFYPYCVGVNGAAYSGSTHAPLARCCGLGRWSSKLPGPRRPADLVGGLSCCLRRNATPCAHKIGRGARAFHVVACATTSPRRGTTLGLRNPFVGPSVPCTPHNRGATHRGPCREPREQ